MSDIEIKKAYVPGSIGRVAELHGTFYSANWGFGRFFEAKVATELSEFIERYDDERDGFWSVSVDGRLEGSISIDGVHADDEGAHLRWFIMSDALRGQGVGGRLMDTAVTFCREKGYKRVYLWTFAGLDAARHLYEKCGFELAGQSTGTQWGTEVTEQRFVLVLD
jgi:GNAT superfamily N-acetyltransferase